MTRIPAVLEPTCINRRSSRCGFSSSRTSLLWNRSGHSGAKFARVTHVRTGDKLVSRQGSHRTAAEDQWKLIELEEALGNPKYEYEYDIEPEMSAVPEVPDPCLRAPWISGRSWIRARVGRPV
jgi:hypothetical protein